MAWLILIFVIFAVAWVIVRAIRRRKRLVASDAVETPGGAPAIVGGTVSIGRKLLAWLFVFVSASCALFFLGALAAAPRDWQYSNVRYQHIVLIVETLALTLLSVCATWALFRYKVHMAKRTSNASETGSAGVRSTVNPPQELSDHGNTPEDLMEDASPDGGWMPRDSELQLKTNAGVGQGAKKDVLPPPTDGALKRATQLAGEVRKFSAVGVLWRFRLERHDPDVGRLEQVEVQMNYVNKGSLNDGDRVTVYGTFDANGVFLAKKLVNHSSGATIAGQSLGKIVLYVILFFLVAGGIMLAIGITLANIH